ncbi:MAG: MBOAT family O-acyltransferase [Ignavibacteriales bacterium]
MLVNMMLLILSIVIYASFGITNLIFIMFSIFTSYIATRCFKSKYKKTILILTIVANASILLVIKFITFQNGMFSQLLNFNVMVPLGVSYYTLQVISYLVDVYKGKYNAEKNIFKYILYITYIPHLFIGPISRYDEIKRSLFARRKFTWDNLYYGSARIVWGLLKKLIIAGRIGILIAIIASNTDLYVGWYVLLAVFMYSIQLYSDFSGGIDIVIGVSRILGIKIQENFDSPFYSQSIKEFWKRWHISLGAWLKEYIYIPLGGNRKGIIRRNINLLITFFISGIWHGINYVLWGIIHGIFVMFGDSCRTPFKWINRLGTFALVSILWVFFIWGNSFVALKMAASIFTTFNPMDVIANIPNLGLSLNDWIILFIFTTIVFVYDGNKAKIKSKLKNVSVELKIAFLCITILLILVLGIYGIGFNVNEFIYSKF